MNSHETAPQEFEGRLRSDRDWREIVAWVGDLPPMPHVAARAISMVENPDTTANELTDLLSSDTALAARVLKIANSAMFARQREITTLNQAIMIIGFKALKGIIVAATLRQLNKQFAELDRLVWEKSMAAAMLATMVTKRLRKPFVEEIFLLGLLHSLGQIVLLAQSDTRSDYKKVIDLIESDEITFAEAEEEVFGFGHPLIGALVAKKWNFSSDACQVILHYQDEIIETPDSELELKTAIVQFSEILVHLAKVGSPEGYPEQTDKLKTLGKMIGFGPKGFDGELKELLEDFQERFSKESHIYS